MPATDALLIHANLRDALATAGGRVHMERMAETFIEMDAGSGSPRAEETPATLVDKWRLAAEIAETFYVDPQMRDVVTAAAATLPEEPLLPEDMPSSHGFALVPGGVGQVDGFGRLIVINAVLWMTTGGFVDILMLTDKYDTNDYYNDEVVREGLPTAANLPRFMPSSLIGVYLNHVLPKRQAFASTLPPDIHVEQREHPDGTFRLHLLRPDGSPAHEDDVPDLDFGYHPEPVSRWLVAMWRLMQQSVSVIERHDPPRQVRRQLKRRNQDSRHVTVVTLRRSTQRGTGTSEVEWTHRWIRRGHWRQQPYKEHGEWVKRAIWIHPTICGPEDKPLLVRDRVYSLRR